MAFLSMTSALALVAALPLGLAMPTQSQNFMLKTEVISGTNQAFKNSLNGLYVSSVHTAAGMGNEMLVREVDTADKYMLDGAIVSKYINEAATSGLLLSTASQKNASNPVQTVTPSTAATSGFYLKDGALQFGGPTYTPKNPKVATDNPFGGWLGEWLVARSMTDLV